MNVRQVLLLLLILPGLLLAQGGRYSVCFCGPSAGCCAAPPSTGGLDAPAHGSCAPGALDCCDAPAPADAPADGPVTDSEPCHGCHHFEVTELTSESGHSVQAGPSLVAWSQHVEQAPPPPARPIVAARNRPPPGSTRPLALRRGVMPMRI